MEQAWLNHPTNRMEVVRMHTKLLMDVYYTMIVTKCVRSMFTNAVELDGCIIYSDCKARQERFNRKQLVAGAGQKAGDDNIMKECSHLVSSVQTVVVWATQNVKTLISNPNCHFINLVEIAVPMTLVILAAFVIFCEFCSLYCTDRILL